MTTKDDGKREESKKDTPEGRTDFPCRNRTALPATFYAGDTVRIARALLGKILLRRLGDVWLTAMICETEAYVGRCDKACHAYGYRRTPRTETLFAPPGTAYVYFVYGMHHCLNVVTEPEGEPSAVLIRGARPLLGHDAMALRRHGRPWSELSLAQRRNLLNGPGRLCQALSIDRAFDHASLVTGPDLLIAEAAPELGIRAMLPRDIRVTPRIGIDYAEEAKDFPWRFLWEGQPKT